MCRIGQQFRCSTTGCEYYKHFGVNCSALKFADSVMAKQEIEKNIAHIKKPTTKTPKKIPVKKTPSQKRSRRLRVIYKRSNGICYICGEPVKFSEMTVDHVIARSRGGSNRLENLRATHHDCNNKKSDKTIEELNLKP